MSNNRPGFTLVELAVALALGGTVLAATVQGVNLTVDMRDRFVQIRDESDRRGIGIRLLRDVLANGTLRSDREYEPSLRGSAHEMELTSTCITATGWRERCNVRIRLQMNGDSTRVLGSFGSAQWEVMLRISGRGEWRYAECVTTGVAWRGEWNLQAALPCAVGLVSAHDTVVVRVWGRE